MKSKVEKEYDVVLDEKKRTTLRGTKFKFFHVKMYDNGSYLLEPRELISPEALAQVEASMKALKAGRKEKAIDFGKLPNV